MLTGSSSESWLFYAINTNIPVADIGMDSEHWLFCISIREIFKDISVDLVPVRLLFDISIVCSNGNGHILTGNSTEKLLL